ncbi:polyketide cyclase/dehydrase/lipid transport protein [Streptomyces sp. TLI_55]|uniref:SRPBCC family protein n=1 Tax=Streptomyces sp. TLI_55 TaxID=1938861 RepID=UPI000BC94B44|nr:SRPBCC family protein [Streptomyces sp. TLI_55]SNX66493.1 polyketide cyclase/dehydrase/lipid transport protein [Streptomyces sp. TLI_55]
MARDHDLQQADPDPAGTTAGDGDTRRRPLRERHVEEVVEVSVPVRTAYDQWTQFKTFPRFTTVVRGVEQLRPTVTVWTLGYGPLRHRFAVEIVEQDPDAYLAWRGLEQHPSHQGEVEFRPTQEGGTAVTVRVLLRPRGVAKVLTGSPHATRLIARLLHRELRNFKGFIEGLGQASGGWRSTIRNGRVQHDHPEPPRSRVAHWPVG